MKKFFSIFSILCFTLLGCLSLCGCGASSYTITVSVPDSLILQLKENEEYMTADSTGAYVVKSDAQIVAEIYLQDIATDYTGLTVKVNDKVLKNGTELLLNTNLSSDSFAARFTLAMAKIKKNTAVEITLGGVNVN